MLGGEERRGEDRRVERVSYGLAANFKLPIMKGTLPAGGDRFREDHACSVHSLEYTRSVHPTRDLSE